MTTPLLTTKLYRPRPTPNLVPRSRLLAQLNGNLQSDGNFARAMTLISAPAGYGKTTLITNWLDHQGFTVGWLSLDESDNDPVRFLAYLLAAIEGIQVGFGESVRVMLSLPETPPPDVILTTLINEIVAVPKSFILVLDDYHVIHNTKIHKQVAFILQHKPSIMHLILITREDPLLPLARIRSTGLITEIRQDDLRFSESECEMFLQSILETQLERTEITALERRTEGWIAGLQLAAISMQRQVDPKKFVRDFTGSSRYVLDYLIEEVFARQSPEMQDFLLKTSILERLSGPLCDAVTEQTKSQMLLEFSEQANLFIVALDSNQEWFRYHRLFAELLRHRLRTDDHLVEADLHNRASLWFRENGFASEAIQHAIAAENWEFAAETIMDTNTEMLRRGEATTLIQWFEKFPQEVIISNPRLCFDYCWPLLLTAQFETAAPLLDHVEKLAQNVPSFLGEVLTAQAFLARSRGDNHRMVEYSQRALKLLSRDSVDSRALVSTNLVLAYWHMGQMEATEQVIDEAIQSSQAIGNTYALTTAIIFKGMVFAVRGDLHQAADIFLQAIEQGEQIPINTLAHLNMSTLHYEWNHLTKSENHLQTAIELCQQGQNNEFLVVCYMFLMRLRVAQGDLEGARQIVSQTKDLIRSGKIPSPTASRTISALVLYSLAHDDLESALQYADQLSDQADCHPFYRFVGLTKARLLITQKNFEVARDYLDQLYEKALQGGWTYAIIAIRVWQAVAAETQEHAITLIADALDLGQSGGFVRTFLEAGEALIPVLQEAARRGISPNYVGKILTAYQTISPVSPDQSGLVEPLSEREIEVLRLIVAGLSNREIAQNLVISLGTAKTHIHNIYGKLEVSNRAQAIARAREYELV